LIFGRLQFRIVALGRMGDSLKIDAMEGQRREMVRVARSILNGSTGVVAGARQLTRLRFPSRVEKDKDILLFVGIDSETDHLPLGHVRRHWNAEVLKAKDEELERFELCMKERAYRAYENFIAKYGSAA
jgi:hypothetical protein